MNRIKYLLALVAAAVLLPSTAQAQKLAEPWLLEVSGAYVWTTGEWAELVKGGWAAGGLIGYAVNPAVYLMGNFNAQWWSGDDCLSCVDWTNYSYFGMLGFNAAARNPKYDALLIIGAGGTTLNPEGGDSNTYFALNGGIRTYFYFKPSVALSLDFMVGVAFTDTELLGFDKLWSFPLGVGVAFRF